jgi:hypothetical protein
VPLLGQFLTGRILSCTLADHAEMATPIRLKLDIGGEHSDGNPQIET